MRKRIREVIPRCKFKNLPETRTESNIGTQLTAEENIEKKCEAYPDTTARIRNLIRSTK